MSGALQLVQRGVCNLFLKDGEQRPLHRLQKGLFPGVRSGVRACPHMITCERPAKRRWQEQYQYSPAEDHAAWRFGAFCIDLQCGECLGNPQSRSGSRDLGHFALSRQKMLNCSSNSCHSHPARGQISATHLVLGKKPHFLLLLLQTQWLSGQKRFLMSETLGNRLTALRRVSLSIGMSQTTG